jgi:hypothetical protein
MRSKSAAARSARDAWLLRPALAFLMALAVAAVVGLLKKPEHPWPSLSAPAPFRLFGGSTAPRCAQGLRGASNPKTRNRS